MEASLNVIFDECVRELEQNGGYALLPLRQIILSKYSKHNDEKSSPVARAFSAARAALDAVADTVSKNDADQAAATTCRGAPLIDPSSDSGGWTGYHNAAVINGRYNQFREGFVFSNGELFDVDLGFSNEEVGEKNAARPLGDETLEITKSGTNFEKKMEELFHIMNDIVADGILRAIERRLELPSLYFQREVGPTNSASQWHMKRYRVTSGNDDDGGGEQDAANNYNCAEASLDNEPAVFLPVHTDPSLISVVILDKPGINQNAMGLEVFSPNKSPDKNDKNSNVGLWKELSHHGHDVATIFVGSVLSYLTKGQIFPAVKHRVVDWGVGNKYDAGNGVEKSSFERMAVTLFVRPRGNALMKILPSPHLKVEATSSKSPPTFRVWNARVAKNYMKRKQKQSRVDL